MRRAVLISLGFHALVILVAIEWVSFRQVNYVPRQVYDVTLVTPAVAEPSRSEARVVEPVPPEPEPEPEEPAREEEMPPPPDKVKKKPPVREKEETKQVPTTEIRKTGNPTPGDSVAAPLTAAPSGPTGSITFEGDFRFSHYIGRMRQKIAATWRPPGGSPDARSCRVYFRVHRDGSVSDVSVEESSGVLLFDTSCQRAVLASAPLPPLPREFEDEYVGVHFSFLYLAP